MADYATPIYNNRLKEVRVGSISGTIDSSFTYNNEGRMTTQAGSTPRSCSWDVKGRLTSEGTETYAYDPLNHRIRRTGGTLGTLDYFLEGEHLESVYKANKIQEKYFRGLSIDELVAGFTLQNGKLTPFFFQHDQVNSIVAVSKPNGGTQQKANYKAFGEDKGTGTQVSRLKYTGREDDGSGLYQYRARYYDPKVGRFISEDPKKFEAGINFFVYCHNNPIICNDPTGLYDSSDILGNAYRGFDAGMQLGAGTGQLALGRTMALGGVTSGNKWAIAGGAYLLVAGTANIQGAGNKYFNIAVGEDYLPTTNFLQGAYEAAAQTVGLSPRVGTVAYNVVETATGLLGDFKPVLKSNNWDYGMAITGPRYTLPISTQSSLVVTNSLLGHVKSGYDTSSSVFDVLPSRSNNNSVSTVYGCR